MYLQSEGWEVVFFKVDFGLWGSLSTLLTVVLGSLGFFFSLSLDWLGGSETKDFRVAKSDLDSGVVLLSEVLSDGFLSLLIFFGFEKSQFFLFEPFSVDFTLDWDFLLDGGGVDVDTLALVVLGKSWFLGFLRFLLFLRDFFNWSGSSDLFGGFFVFISVEFIVNITDVSSSSTLFSGSVFSSSSASSVKRVAFWDSLGRSALSVMSDLFGVVSDSDWDFGVDTFSGGGLGCFGSELFQLSSFLVG